MIGSGTVPDRLTFYSTSTGGSRIDGNNESLALGEDFSVYYNCPSGQVPENQLGIFTT